MNTLTWNSNKNSYQSVTSDGKQMSVDADIYAEARLSRMKEGETWEEADVEISRVSNWDESMDGVEVVQ